MENQSPLYIGNLFVYHEKLYNNFNEMGLTIESDWKRFDFTFYLTKYNYWNHYFEIVLFNQQ